MNPARRRLRNQRAAKTSSTVNTKHRRPKGKLPHGRPPEITDTNKWEVLAVVAVTGSVRRAADYVGVTESAVRDLANRDPDFSARLKRARADRRLLSERKVRDSAHWQAHAWYLERRHAKEYARRQIVEHVGRDGGPIKTDATVAERADLAHLTAEELEQRAQEMTPEQAAQLYLSIAKRAKEA